MGMGRWEANQMKTRRPTADTVLLQGWSRRTKAYQCTNVPMAKFQALDFKQRASVRIAQAANQ